MGRGLYQESKIEKRYIMINNRVENPIASEWKKRYSELTEEVKNEIEALEKLKPKEYQLRVIKKTKPELQEGDVFVLSPRENIYFYGKILRTNINHIERDTFVHGKNVVFIFNNKTTKPTIDDFEPDYSNLLIRPCIVDVSYWNKGLFFNVGKTEITDFEKELDYGFYKIGMNSNWYCKEDGTVLNDIPDIVGMFGVATMNGISSQIEKEIIINPNLLIFNEKF